MSNINTTKQSFNTLIIIIGAGLMVYDFVSKPDVVYYKIAGLAILMFGLYKSTRQWTVDNKRNEDAEEDNTSENE